MNREVKEYLEKMIASIAKRRGRTWSPANQEVNLLDDGLLDSMSFLELITLVESHFNIRIDFSEVEPGFFTSYSGLLAQILKSVKNR